MVTTEPAFSRCTINYSKEGKPFIQTNDKEKYTISFSYTQKKGIISFSSYNDMAIDMEASTRSVHPGLRARLMHSSEIEKLSHIPTIHLWTMKEAVAKLNGKGISLELNTIKIFPISPMLYLSYLTSDNDHEPYAYIHTFYIDQCIISLAIKDNKKECYHVN